MPSLYKLSSFISGKVKVPRKFRLLTLFLLSGVAYSFWPFGKASLLVHPGSVEFELPSFQQCVITFDDTVFIQQVMVEPTNEKGGPESSVQPVNQELKKFTFTNSVPPITAPTSEKVFRVRIRVTSNINPAITGFALDRKKLLLKEVHQQYLKSAGDYTRIRFIRRDIADLLFLINDHFSNVLMLALVLWILMLMPTLVITEYYVNFAPADKFKAHIINVVTKESGKNDNLWERYTAMWSDAATHFQFAQAVGPALGFLLTVSGLIQAIYPGLGDTRDMDIFLKGLNVALVSTFLGLFLRILALEASRIHYKSLERAEACLLPLQYAK